MVTPVPSSQAGEIGVFDLDNDGDLDIVCTDPGPASRVYLYRNEGDGVTFTFMSIIADDDGLPFGVGGGSLDEDGNVDLVFNNALGHQRLPRQRRLHRRGSAFPPPTTATRSSCTTSTATASSTSPTSGRSRRSA